MKDQIMAILNDSNPFNKKAKAEELEAPSIFRIYFFKLLGNFGFSLLF